MAIEKGRGEAVERDDTFFLPAGVEAMLADKGVEPGDVIRFQVVGRDSDGNIEVAYAKNGESKPEMSLAEKLTNDMKHPMPEMEGEEEGY